MKHTMTLIACIVAISFLLLSAQCSDAAAMKPAPQKGLSMELIHIHSPKSPLYPGNISHAEGVRRLVGRSNARAQYINAKIASASPSLKNNNMSQPLDVIRGTLEFAPFASYIMQVGLGTFDEIVPGKPFKAYYLYIDTGSNLLWTLCEDCLNPPNQCFHTREPPFPSSQSKTYKPLPCNGHPLCKPDQCVRDFCSENSVYATGTVINSILAAETFTFLTPDLGLETIQGLVFGCAYNATNVPFGELGDFKISGILGLGYAPDSFPMQISNLINATFSFCLSRQLKNFTYLRFGSDIPIPASGLRVTKLVFFLYLPYYFVNLQGISVQGEKLPIDPAVFALKQFGGGCFLDNGSSFTFLITPAYNALFDAVMNYLLKFPAFIRRPSSPADMFGLCYKNVVGYEGLPTLTLHLENADLEIRPEDAFIKMADDDDSLVNVTCLAFMENKYRTVIGSFQQTNYRFIYDLDNKLLKFAPEDCAKNA